MSSASVLERGIPRAHDPDALDDLCRTVFESLPRVDQRRWAETYVRGLVTVSGRKSVRRISEQAGGRPVAQCLQQFVNQSPWSWAPVRRVLTRATEATIPIRAWVLQELEFAKDGTHSVGVASQFIPAARRSVNCQLGLAVWLAGDAGSVPVNWRLMLPPAWDADRDRRLKAGLPDAERHRPTNEHVLDALDEMVRSWRLAPRPVVGDRTHDRHLEPLLLGLEERDLPYLLRISDRTPLSRSGGPVGGRRLVARWPHGRSRPAELWLTSLTTTPVPELLRLIDIGVGTVAGSARLRSGVGLDHFEGRSFRGWHHHVTLASVAHAHLALPAGRRFVLRPGPASSY